MINKIASKEYYIDSNGYLKEVAGGKIDQSKSDTYSKVLDYFISGNEKVVIGMDSGWASYNTETDSIQKISFENGNAGVTIGDNGSSQVVIIDEQTTLNQAIVLAHELVHALRGEYQQKNTGVEDADEEAYAIALENKIRTEVGYNLRTDGDSSIDEDQDGVGDGDNTYGSFDPAFYDKNWFDNLTQGAKSETGKHYNYYDDDSDTTTDDLGYDPDIDYAAAIEEAINSGASAEVIQELYDERDAKIDANNELEQYRDDIKSEEQAIKDAEANHDTSTTTTTTDTTDDDLGYDSGTDYGTAIQEAINSGASAEVIQELYEERDAKIDASNGELDQYRDDIISLEEAIKQAEENRTNTTTDTTTTPTIPPPQTTPSVETPLAPNEVYLRDIINTFPNLDVEWDSTTNTAVVYKVDPDTGERCKVAQYKEDVNGTLVNDRMVVDKNQLMYDANVGLYPGEVYLRKEVEMAGGTITASADGNTVTVTINDRTMTYTVDGSGIKMSYDRVVVSEKAFLDDIKNYFYNADIPQNPTTPTTPTTTTGTGGGHELTLPDEVRGNINGSEKVLYPNINWSAYEYASKQGETGKTNEDKYKIAVGPKILNPNYEDTGHIWGSDFDGLNKNVDVVLENKTTGEKLTLNCYVTDIKAHTFNNYGENVSFDIESGLVQTGAAYPNSWNYTNETPFSEGNCDSSVIEFILKPTDFDTSDYKLCKVITYN